MARQHMSTYTVSYDSESHWKVVTKMWGSSWPKVVPYCVFNVLLMILLTIIDSRTKSFRLEISPQGHTFITMVVAFLLVSRVNTGLSRYNMARGNMGDMFQHVRELVQGVVVFSNHDTSEAAKLWRHTVTYRTLVILRTAMVVIDYLSIWSCRGTFRS